MRRAGKTTLLCCAVGAAAAFNPDVGAAIIWDGPAITFTKPDFANYQLPENQDHITDGVWITRASGAGIFNIAVESGYSGLSPADTEWASGAAGNWASLTFQPWVDWHSHNPPSVLDVDAVVHLITPDIYIDIKFLSWTPGGQGGGFSYLRSTVPGPSALAALALGLVPAWTRRRRGRGPGPSIGRSG